MSIQDAGPGAQRGAGPSKPAGRRNAKAEAAARKRREWRQVLGVFAAVCGLGFAALSVVAVREVQADQRFARAQPCAGQADVSGCLETIAVQVVSTDAEHGGKSTAWMVTVSGLGARPRQVQLDGASGFADFTPGAAVDAQLWQGRVTGFEIDGVYVATVDDLDDTASLTTDGSLLLFVAFLELLGVMRLPEVSKAKSGAPLTRDQLRVRVLHATLHPFLAPLALAYTVEVFVESRLLLWELPVALGFGLAGLAVGVTVLRVSLRRRARGSGSVGAPYA